MQIIIKSLPEIIWNPKYDGLSAPRNWGIKFVRFLHGLYVEFAVSQIKLRAMSLVYMSMLTLVPLLAVTFSMLKGFGVHKRIEPLLLNFFSALGPKGVEVVNRIMEFVSNVQVGVLGTVSFAFLLYIAINIISKVEESFNSIWKAGSPRPFARRFTDYLSIIIIGPIVINAVLALTTFLLNKKFIQYLLAIEPFGSIYVFSAKLTPYILVCAAFTFIYKYFPNTRVQLRAALAGGLVAGISWQTLGWAFASFVVNSVKYKTIYSGFAIVIFLMLWIYFNWMLILIGVAIAFLWQYPPTEASVRIHYPSSMLFSERLAFGIMFLIAKNFYTQGGPTELLDINMKFNAPPGMVQQSLDLLKKNGLIIKLEDKTEAYVPGRALETIYLTDIAETARAPLGKVKESTSSIPEVEEVVERLENAIAQSLGRETLQGIVARDRANQSEEKAPHNDQTV